MTVRYRHQMTGSKFGGLVKQLFRWRGSVYKALWFEFLVFISIYTAISCTYHYAMTDYQQLAFEKIATYCNLYSNRIPLSFVLGFYVSLVMKRFWEQFNLIPWPNRIAVYVAAYIQSNDEKGRIMRRTIMRYLCASFVMTAASISPPIKKRFPTPLHLVEAGFLLANEQQIIDAMPTTTNKYFVPFIWATSIVRMARKEGKIKDDLSMQKLYAEINDFRGCCGGLFAYDWITIPLVYTQVVTIAVYIYILACLLGRYQFDQAFGAYGDKHVPFITMMQFLIYMGWLKVAESGINPFGEDDDDFEINSLIDRYLHESYMVVDEMFNKMPATLKDRYWNKVDFYIPYNVATIKTKKDEYLGSAADMKIPESKQGFVDIIIEVPEIVIESPDDLKKGVVQTNVRSPVPADRPRSARPTISRRVIMKKMGKPFKGFGNFQSNLLSKFKTERSPRSKPKKDDKVVAKLSAKDTPPVSNANKAKTEKKFKNDILDQLKRIRKDKP